MKRLKYIFFIVIILATTFPSPQAYGLSGSEWKAGRIIDDSLFFDSKSMDAAAIQAFLNAQVPTCDTWGQKMYSTTQTRAQRGTSKGVPPPYVCLKDYQENPTTKANNLATAGAVEGGWSAAQIIKYAADTYNISPKALIVLLQKEQGIVTDDWPWPGQYRSATGYGCPDTAPCDAEYYGFYNQVVNAAAAFRRYANYPQNYRYKAGRDNSILYNPNAGCGSSNVYIQNQATAGLYIYTPYQPNVAALNNLYGTGDSCSAYGNRNFWRMYNDWFGRTERIALPGCTQSTNTSLVCVWKVKNYATGTEYLTSSHDELNYYVNTKGYSYIGLEFIARNSVAPQSGNIPVYKLVNATGDFMVTTDQNEKSALIANGYIDNGVLFYADRAGSNSGYPVYRLMQTATSKHIWTSDLNQVYRLTKNGYTYQGEAFTSLSQVRQETPPPVGQSLVYRFGSMPGNRHFWTVSVEERDNMIKAGYRYEGVAWRSQQDPTTVPVYRLYSSTMMKHLFTTDAYEKDVLDATTSWEYEGIGFYSNPSTTGAPVYRLYGYSNGTHFFTTDSYERSELVRTRTFRDEGVAWRQP